MSSDPATSFADLASAETPTIESAAQLATAVEELVDRGDLAPGDRLPSVRDAAALFGLAPNTVAAAYRRLRDRSVVVGRGRQGTQVAPTSDRRAVVGAPLPSGIVDAMSGNPDPELLPDLGPALAAAAASPRADYGSSLISPSLVDAARSWLESDDIPTDSLTLASGAMDAIERVLFEHLRPGDPVGVEDPGHVPVFDVVAALGLVAIPMQVDHEGVTPEALRNALDRGAKAVVITPRAHNPTGAAITRNRAVLLGQVLADHPHALVVEDDHAGPVSGVPLASLPRNRHRWALVRSVSKSLGPDLRLAILTGDPATVAAVESRFATGPGWVSHLVQLSVAHLLADPETLDLVARAAATYAARRTRLIETLAHAGIDATGDSGLQVWVPVPDEQSVADAVRNGGYAIRIGSAYRRTTQPAIRVTVSSIDDDQIDHIARLLIDSLASTGTRRASSV